MEERLKKHLDQLHAFDDERRAWLVLSSFVVFVVIGVIFTWDSIVHERAIWFIVTCGLSISMVWWYWTMRLVRHMLHTKHTEYQVLHDIVTMVREVKDDVKNLGKTD